MDDTEEWLAAQAVEAQDLAKLLQGLCERIARAGVPLLRGHFSLSVVDPMIRARSYTWERSKGVRGGDIPHETEEGVFSGSPFAALMQAGETMRHWRFDAPEERRAFPLFDDIAAIGGTDYMAALYPFSGAAFPGLRGVGFAMTVDRPGGLTEGETTRLLRLCRAVASIVHRVTLGDIAVALMDAYVGAPASRRILAGEVRRGQGTEIEAVLMMADLVGFTAKTDAGGTDLIGRLDEHLEAMARPVIARGGSVLKFMGDGVLAAFPVTATLTRKAACELALAAAVEAMARNEAVNRVRAGEMPLLLDIAVNYGQVFFGNVGTPGRLDFTVIGPAVNEVSRMEALCGHGNPHLLISKAVASELPGRTVSLGLHRLRGVEQERELFALAAG